MFEELNLLVFKSQFTAVVHFLGLEVILQQLAVISERSILSFKAINVTLLGLFQSLKLSPFASQVCLGMLKRKLRSYQCLLLGSQLE